MHEPNRHLRFWYSRFSGNDLFLGGWRVGILLIKFQEHCALFMGKLGFNAKEGQYVLKRRIKKSVSIWPLTETWSSFFLFDGLWWTTNKSGWADSQPDKPAGHVLQRKDIYFWNKNWLGYFSDFHLVWSWFRRRPKVVASPRAKKKSR